MKRTLRLISFALIILFASCKKKDKRVYSDWFINDQEISSNNTVTTIGKAMGRIDCNDPNRFSLTFTITGDGLPTQYGFFVAKLSDSLIQNPQLVHMDINYNSNYYIPSESCNSILTASESADNKAKYVLPPTWFVNYYNHDDSVLVKGNFNQP